MSSSESIDENTNRGGMLRRLGIVLLAVWSLLILGIFIGTSSSLVLPLAGFFKLLGFALLTLCTFMFGGWRARRFLARWLPGNLDPIESTVYEFSLGVGIVIFAMILMGALGLYNLWALGVLIVCLLSGNPLPFLKELKSRLNCLSEGGYKFYYLILVLVGVMTFLECLAPETSQDALVYHLAIPDIYIRNGGFEYVPGNFFANFPQNMEMLFTLGLMLDGSSLAAYYHWLLGLFTALAVAALARQISGGKGGILSATVFATIPTVALIATWSYVDLGLVFFEVVAVLAFLRWWNNGSLGWLFFAAINTGLAAGCKYTGGAIGILIGIAIFFEGAKQRRKLKESLVFITLFSVVSLSIVSPWYIKNFVYTGNPIYPFMYTIFGGKDWDLQRSVVLSEFLNSWGSSEGFLDFISLPWKLTFFAKFFSIESFDGLIGPIFLLASPIIFVSLKGTSNARIVFFMAAGLALFWVLMSRQIRFLLPALACVSAILGGSQFLYEKTIYRRVLVTCLGISFAFNTLVISTHFASHNPIPVVLGFEHQEQYLAREVPGGDYPLFQHINTKLPQNAYVLFAASGNPGFLCQRKYRVDAIFENETLMDILEASKDSEKGILGEFKRRGFTHVLFRWNLVFNSDELKSEIRLDDQLRLQSFLNQHCEIQIVVNGTHLFGLKTDQAVNGGAHE